LGPLWHGHAVMPPERPTPSRKERAWLVGTAVLPALVATGQLDGYAGGGRDDAIVRAVGLGQTGPFRALDTWIAAPFAMLPVGTRTLRAELPGTFLLAATAGLAFLVVRRAIVAVSGPSGWSSVVAAIATSAVSLSYPLQHEATCSGSSLAGVVLVLLALSATERTAPPLLAGLFTLGLTYDVPVGMCVAAALVAATLSRSTSESAPARTTTSLKGWLHLAIGGGCGLAPIALATFRSHATALSTSAPAFATMFGDAPVVGVHRALELLVAELGEAILVLAAVGLAAGLWSRKARAQIVPLATVGIVAGLAFAQVSGGTNDAWSPAALGALVAGGAFAAVAMYEAVLRVSRARVPLASASAAMVVVLEAAFPAVQLDDGLARASVRPAHALSTWEDTAFAGLGSGAIVLVSSPKLYARLLATKASGALPGDLQMLPAFDPANEASAAALAHDPRLVPLFRDLALTAVPQELSLSTLAADRPLALATDPRWDKNLTRHLLPGGLLAMFEPEPRGGADRKRALEDSQPWRARLATNLGTPMDPALASLTASILFDRAVAAVQTGEREVALQATQDAAIFAPKDARIHELTRRQVSAHGAVDVRDLARLGLAAQ
jgi:hypothetical protein